MSRINLGMLMQKIARADIFWENSAADASRRSIATLPAGTAAHSQPASEREESNVFDPKAPNAMR